MYEIVVVTVASSPWMPSWLAGIAGATLPAGLPFATPTESYGRARTDSIADCAVCAASVRSCDEPCCAIDASSTPTRGAEMTANIAIAITVSIMPKPSSPLRTRPGGRRRGQFMLRHYPRSNVLSRRPQATRDAFHTEVGLDGRGNHPLWGVSVSLDRVDLA